MEDVSAMRYEFMIRRAYDCGRGKKGADADIFSRLKQLERYANEDAMDTKAQRQYQKQREEVKEYCQNALEKAIKTVSKKKKTDQDRFLELQGYANTLDVATTSEEIAGVISAIVGCFNDLKIGND